MAYQDQPRYREGKASSDSKAIVGEALNANPRVSCDTESSAKEPDWNVSELALKRGD